MGAPSLARERVQAVLDCLAAGMNPMQASRATGVSKSACYRLDRSVTGRSRLAVKQEAAAGRAARGAAGPGRPLARERVRAVLDCFAGGMTGMQASRATGVSRSACYRLLHSIGGVCRPSGTTYSDRYLNREKRVELARLREAGLSMRAIGERIGVNASTVSRELARNAHPKTGYYQPERADRVAWERQRRPKPSRLSANPVLRGQVQEWLDRRYSPEEISGRLKVAYPGDEAMRVSHETIYQSIYVYPRGELKRELQASLRTGRELRRRRGRRQAGGHIVDAVPIGERPPEVEGRIVPGHHEGDLILGSRDSNSAVGTIVERVTGYLTLLHLPHGRDAGSVADAIIDRMSELPAWFTKTLTWDRGQELAQHQRVTATGIQVYFADPYSPWQRGSNENINGLLREYLPKGTDLSTYTAADLQHIADELNDRPRKRFGYYTPREELAKLLAQETERVATTP